MERLGKTLLAATLVIFAAGAIAEEFNYGSAEELLYEISFGSIDVDNVADWSLPNGSSSFTVDSGYLETKNSGWIKATLDFDSAIGEKLDLANKKTSIYFSARFGLLTGHTGNKLGFLLNSTDADASYPYMGAYLADKNLDPIQDGLGYGSTFYSVAPQGIDMAANRADFDDFRLIYTDNLDGTMTLELERDADQNGNWTNVSTTLLEGAGDFGSGWRTTDRFGNPLVNVFEIVFRDIDNAVESFGVTQTELQDLYDYEGQEVCFQHNFEGESNGGFDFGYMDLAHHFKINTDSSSGINYLDRLYDSWNGMTLDMQPEGIITSGKDFKFLINNTNTLSVYLTAKFAGTGTGNKIGVLLKSADDLADASYMGAYIANEGSGQAHLGIGTTHMGGWQNSDHEYDLQVDTQNFIDYRLDFTHNGDNTVTLSLNNDPNQNGNWNNIHTVTIPTVAGSGTDDITAKQAFGSYEVDQVIIMFRSAADGVSKMAVTGCSSCVTPSGDSNNDCVVDILDFAMFAEDWLKCGFEQTYLCP